MRFLAVAVLSLLATSAFAQSEPSIWFARPVYQFRQREVPYIQLRASGIVKTPIIVDYSWEFPGGHRGSGTVFFDRYQTSGMFVSGAPAMGPLDLSIDGTLTISYRLSVTETITKTATIRTIQTFSLVQDYLRVAETDAPERALAVTLDPPSGFPITYTLEARGNTASTGTDYSLIDTTISFPPGETTGEIRFRVEPDGVKEGPEDFRIRAVCNLPVLHCSSTEFIVTIVDDYARGVFTPAQLNVFRGDPFEFELGLNEMMANGFVNSPVAITMEPNIAILATKQLLAKDGTLVVGKVRGNTAKSGEAKITATFSPYAFVIPAEAILNVYDGDIVFDDFGSLEVGTALSVGVRMTPPPPEELVFIVQEHDRVYTGIVEYGTELRIDTTGRGVMPIVAAQPGTTKLFLFSPNQTREIAYLRVNVLDPLSVASLVPDRGRAGTPVTIRGKGFRGACLVFFGDSAAADVRTIGETELRATAPPHAPGDVDVTVRCGDKVYVLAGAFTYPAPSKRRSARH